ncbi:beta strand repeat-containing protein [Hymenobacter rubripertinctus]|uniref:T9SS C-terminal target domain-containing protein n=1 Tax=Hymenobacter rubripertinctus TaxID=2029981 RepID=A0A418R3E9_9BACT|nr:T9SS type A sorting domain-containing protein [Hymenobacter rubripertinctus]RIY11849.1 T9SS C-terminal target domain-containing protein [Hymenobacter rubripertinctus]
MLHHYQLSLARSKKALMLSALLLAFPGLTFAATIKWVGATGAPIDVASSWVVVDPTTYQPTGAGNKAPEALDVLVFDGSQTPTASVQTIRGNFAISQLLFINNVSATFIAPSTSNGAGTIVITNNFAGDDFVISAGSSFTLLSTAATSNRYTVIQLGAGATSSIAGSFFLTGSSSSPLPQRVIAASANAVQVQNGGSVVTQNILGFPFGSTGSIPAGNSNVNDDIATTAGSVVFNSGSTFQQITGGYPFSDGANPVTVFNSGSTYIYSGGTFSPVGQQYGNLQFLSPATVAGANNMVIQNDLTVTGVTVNLNSVGTGASAGTLVGGNIVINSNATPTAGILNFTPASASNVTLNGSTAQTVGGIGAGTGSGTLTFGANARLVVNNSSATGVTMLKPVTVTGLTLTNGILTTLNGNAITVPFDVATGTDTRLTGGSAASFVNGPLTRSTSVAASGAPNIVYPIGAIRASTPVYRPLTFSPNQPSANTYTAQQFEGSPTARTFPPSTPSSIKRVSRIRYFNVSAGTGATFNNGKITLSFGPDDQVDNTSKLRIALSSGSTWTDIGGNSNLTSSTLPYFTGTIQSSSPFATLGDFVLASTELSQGPNNNPLPVTLTSFAASRQAHNVLAKWTTASEVNNAYFEVQRSLDGQNFTAAGKVTGNGTTVTGAFYSFTDRNAEAATSYYRLQQVDFDGKQSYSSVVTVAGLNTIAATFYPNPSNTSITLPNTLQAVQYRVYTAAGRTVLAGSAVGGSEVNMQQVPAGLYFLELTTGDHHNVQRFVRQ